MVRSRPEHVKSLLEVILRGIFCVRFLLASQICSKVILGYLGAW